MAADPNQKILDATREWYKQKIIAAHKLRSRQFLNEVTLNINPLTVHYLAKLTGGDCTPHSLARALLYPRILGTSINTSFGTNFQKFIVEQIREAFGSVVAGMDIEFLDQIDGRRKYSQVKLGTNTINYDDVKTIIDKFKGLIRFARTNSLDVRQEDVMLGVLIGQHEELNGNYKMIEADNWQVIVGKEFWKRLTGDETMMERLVSAIQEQGKDYEDDGWLEELVVELASKDFIKRLAAPTPKSLD